MAELSSPPSGPLSIAVIGGSITGLACAFALQEAGHRVTLYERSDGAARGAGPIKCMPNMTKLLEKWGMGDDLRSKGTVCNAMQFTDSATGELVGKQVFHQSVMRHFGADIINIQEGDLHDIILSRALEAGVTIRYRETVVGIDPWTAVVFLESGENALCDLVVGADGRESAVRRTVLGMNAVGARNPRVHYSFAVSFDDIEKEPELKRMMETSDWQFWMGDDCFLQGFPSHSRREFLGALRAPARVGHEMRASWVGASPAALDLTQLDIDGLAPSLRKLLRVARRVVPTTYTVYEPFHHWVHEASKVILAGSAAHPLPPNGAQGLPLKIEDAATLGGLFSLLKDRAHIPAFLSAYEDLRLAHCATTRTLEHDSVELMCIPSSSPIRALRNAGLQAAMAAHVEELDEASEPMVAAGWHKYVQSWGHDAAEAVEDWWSSWGWRFGREESTVRVSVTLAEREFAHRVLNGEVGA